MNLPFNFDYYLKKGVVRRISPDISRANFLIEEARKSFIGLNRRIKSLGIDEYSANSIIKDIYDIIMQNVRAKMLLEGFKASGNFSHEAEVSFMFNLSFNEGEVSFMNGLRASRNGITYYGKVFEKEYSKRCFDFLNKIKKKIGLD